MKQLYSLVLVLGIITTTTAGIRTPKPKASPEKPPVQQQRLKMVDIEKNSPKKNTWVQKTENFISTLATLGLFCWAPGFRHTYFSRKIN